MYKMFIFFVFLIAHGSAAFSQTPQEIQNRSREIEAKALAEKSQRDQAEARKVELQRERQWNEEHPGMPYPRQASNQNNLPPNQPAINTTPPPPSKDAITQRSREIEANALAEKCQREQADFRTLELQRERQWVEEKPGIPYPRKAAPPCGTSQNPTANAPQPKAAPPQAQPANATPQDITQRSREIEARALTEKCLREQADQRALELQRERQWIEEKPGIPYPRKPLINCGENKAGSDSGFGRPGEVGDANLRPQNASDEAILRQLREAREKIDAAERMILNRQSNPSPQSNNSQSPNPQDDIFRRSRDIQAEGEQRRRNEQQADKRSNQLAQTQQTIELNPQSPYVNRIADIDPATGNPRKKPGFSSNDLKRDYLGSYLATMPGIDNRY